jgi:hypothetical protein
MLAAFNRSWGIGQLFVALLLVVGAGVCLPTLPGTFFGWTALRSGPRKDGAAVAREFLLKEGLIK